MSEGYVREYKRYEKLVDAKDT